MVRQFPVLASVLFAMVAMGGLAISANSAEPRPRHRTLGQAIQLQKRHSDRLLAIRDVVGTATGVDREGKFTIKVFARKAGVTGVPEELDGMPVVVEATGEFFALQSPRHRGPTRYPRRSPGRRSWGPGRRPPAPDRQPQEHDYAPTVMIVTPSDGEVVSEDVAVSAIAEDDGGVVVVDFFVDDVFLGSDSDETDDWSILWDSSMVDDGQYTLTAEATDTIGQSSSDSIEVLIDNKPGPFSPDGRPTPIGVSTGNSNECSSGTIGCRVKDAQGSVYVLSNNHVYARLNDAQIGESIVQPGLFDTDCTLLYSDQIIGILADFVPLDFGGTGANTVDAAIALITSQDVGIATPGDGYGVPKSVPVMANIDQFVQKYGRTTALTEGYVSGIEATVVVNYGDRSARFVDQIIVNGAQGFIEAGDSGSLLVTYDPDPAGDGGRQPVGLLFAGNADGSIGLANSIDDVLGAFDVSIDGE